MTRRRRWAVRVLLYHTIVTYTICRPWDAEFRRTAVVMLLFTRRSISSLPFGYAISKHHY